MTQKEKLLRKQRIKDIFLKTLHVVSYILSVLFIIICFIAGVKGCDKQTYSVSAEEERPLVVRKSVNVQELFDQYTFSYRQKLTDTFTLSYSDNVTIFDYFDVPNGIVSSSSPALYFHLYSSQSFVLYKVGEDIVDLNSIVFYFVAQPNAQNNYLYRLRYIYCGDSNTDWARTIVYKTSGSADSLEYSYSGGYQLLFKNDTEVFDNEIFLMFYAKNDVSNFTFNKQFNYNAPLNTNVLGLYGSMNFDTSGANIRWKNYNVGYFYSNGQIFNQIQYTCVYSDAVSVLYNDGTIDLAPSGYWVYGWLSYVNTDTNHTEVVNRHDQQPYNHNGGYTYYYANSSTWTNDGFRYITFFESLSESDSIIINSFNNNNQNYYSGQIYSDGGDAFTLLSLAFSSLSSLWSINILPNITLGVLFFLPAVVGVIIIIVHILRK